MSLAEQLQAVFSQVSTLEQTAASQSQQTAAMIQQITRLTAENAALKQQLSQLPSNPPPDKDLPAIGWGFVASEVDPPAAVRAAITRVKADGGKWIRLWHSNFTQLSAANVALINVAADAGLNVILCVQPKDTEPQNLGQPDFATFVSKNAATLKRLYAVEAGNELNLVLYRPDDLGGGGTWQKPYVDRWLRPLSKALAGIGVKTLCTSIADGYNPQNYGPPYDALLAAGAADCCDGIAIHCYFQPSGLPALATIMANLKTKWNKPVHVTECNVLTKGLSQAQWQQQFPPYIAALRSAGVFSVQLYRGVPKVNGKWSWPTIVDANGAATDAYAVMLAAVK